MRVRIFSQGLLWIYAITIIGCGPPPSSDWILISEDSLGKSTFINGESIRRRDNGVSVYRMVVGEPLSADGVEFVQGLDCVNLRWSILTLDEALLDSIAETNLYPEEWGLLAFAPANRALLEKVCDGFPPDRWIRVLEKDSNEPGELKEVWVDRETITGPSRDSVWTEFEDLGYSEEVFRSWTRWHDASPDNGFFEIQADVACDRGVLRYLENWKYSKEGELVHQAESVDLWFPMFQYSFEEQVFDVVCAMGEFF